MWSFKRKKTKAKPKPKKSVTPHAQMVRRQVIIGVILFVVIAALLGLTGYVTQLPAFQIKDVSVTGGFTIPHTTIKEAAEAQLSGKYLKLIPHRFAPLYPQTTIEQTIAAISRVKHVRVELDDNKNLVVAFEEYRPQALWCAHTEDTACLFIDAEGYAFAPAPNLTGGAFVRYINGETPELKEHFIDPAFIDTTDRFIERLEKELSLFVTHVVVSGDYDIEYQVAGGGRIKVSQEMSSDVSFNNLKTVLTSEEFAHLEPGTFHYIDLRFGDKVFVNEVEPDEEVASTTEEASGLSE